MLDGMTCIYRNSVDLFFYVMGSANENGVRIYSLILIFILIKFVLIANFGQCDELSL